MEEMGERRDEEEEQEEEKWGEIKCGVGEKGRAGDEIRDGRVTLV